jgi:DNA-directed RNA polymerase subunit RPC12/RpoP
LRYIKPCPECSVELRFPIDRGTLVVKCPNCGHQFWVDPSDPKTFSVGKFDYISKASPVSPNKGTFLSTLEPFLGSIFNNRVTNSIKKFIPVILFTLLFIHILRMFSPASSYDPQEKNIEKKLPKGHPPIDTQPFPENEKENVPSKEPEFQT